MSNCRADFENFIKNPILLKRDEFKYVNKITQLQWEAWKAAWDQQQAEIDRLMLEFCPDEMSTKQLEEWAQNQRFVNTDSVMTKLL